MGPVIGVDVGQKRDPTAVCVVELEERGGESHYLVRHLERLALGTAYPAVVERLHGIASGIARRCGRRPRLYLDATGVGKPVLDLLVARVPEAIGVYFVRGDQRREEVLDGRRQVKLGKAHLVRRLQALMDHHRIHLPQTPEAKALGRELANYEIRIDEKARGRFGAFRSGTHDDLVTALALAVQEGVDF